VERGRGPEEASSKLVPEHLLVAELRSGDALGGRGLPRNAGTWEQSGRMAGMGKGLEWSHAYGSASAVAEASTVVVVAVVGSGGLVVRRDA